MRILLIGDGLHPHRGGPPRVIVQSALGLSQCGHDVVILSPSAASERDTVRAQWPALEEADITVDLVEPVGYAGFFFDGALPARIVERILWADVVHIHQIWSALAVGTGRCCRSLGTPYVVSAHGQLDPWSMRQSRWKKTLALRIGGASGYLAGAAAVVFGTEAEADDAVSLPSSARAAVVPNGAVLPAEHPVPAELRERLRTLAPNAENWDHMLLFYSRLHPKKGLDLLIEAFARVAGRYPGWGLLAAGIAEDAEFERGCLEEVRTHGLVSRVTITHELTGDVSQFLYTMCDAFVLPTHQEGFSMAVLEAMAHRCPMVVTTPCRIPEIEDRGAGFVAAPDVTSIARALDRMMSQDDVARAAQGDQSRRLVEQNFRWPVVARGLEQVYAAALLGDAS